MIAPTKTENPVLNELRWFLARARAPRLRTMRQFAEKEIIVPDGPFEGRRFSCSRQPYSGLWFDAVDSGRFNRHVATGPTQSGKTLSCFITPLLYHLFEIGETTICGLPSMDMANDKWREDIKPAIERSRYRDLLPTRGLGARGGKFDSIRFNHGATLKFMTGGGSDKSRAGFTSRVLVVTETDGMDESGENSREADKITQLEARTRAYANRKRVYMECTVSVEDGRTWREYRGGTESRIVLHCPHCKGWVYPEREQLHGWQSAQSENEARDGSQFFCPGCGEAWSERDRKQANLESKLLHRGQAIGESGEIEGDVPKTSTLGFRWSAVNNLFATAADIGADEWRASRATDEDNAEKELRQFVWALPHKPEVWDATPLEPSSITARTAKPGKGIVQEDAEYFTLGIDAGKWLCHWTAMGFSEGATPHVVDYSRFEVPSESMGVEKALMNAFRAFRDDVILIGWPDGKGGMRVPDCVWIDAGFKTPVFYDFVRESNQLVGKKLFWATVGRGESQVRQQRYSKPKTTGALVKLIGEGYHVSLQPQDHVLLVEVNADHWKTWVHERLSAPKDKPGSMTLYDALPRDHLAFTKHLTAEKQVTGFEAGRGTFVRWEKLREHNHWLDSTSLSCGAGHMAGARLIEPQKTEPTLQRPRPAARPTLRMPDGRPFLVTER